MKKQFLLAAMAFSLILLGYGILWPGGSAAMPMPLETPTPAETPTPVPDLTLDKGVAGIVTDLDGDGKVDPGDTISYTISYSNTAEITATNVILVDNYDETLIESVANIIGGGEDDGNVITWELGTLGAPDKGSVGYEATLKETLPPGTTALENEASICSNEVEPIRVAQTVPVQRPELNIIKAREAIDLDGDEVIGGGDIIKYKITYENTGEAAAANVVVVDDYPESLIASIDNISGDGEDDGSAITWMLGTVKAGAKASLTYEVTLKSKFPPGTTSVDNTAEIRSDETYPVLAEQSVPIINLPNLTITKERAPGLINDLNGNGLPDPGDTVKYHIEYQNIGDANATEVTIVDDYDETLIASLDNISGDGEDDGSAITWQLDILAAGESGSLSYEAMLKETFPLGSTDVQNEATIFSNETEPTSATETVKVEVAPTPTPTPVPEEGTAAGVFQENPKLVSCLIAFLAFIAMGVLAYVATCVKYRSDGKDKAGVVSTPRPDPPPKSKEEVPVEEKPEEEEVPVEEKPCECELNRERIRMVREGVFLVFIVSAILILAMGQAIEPDGAISILSAIAGYVFGRARP